MLLICKEDWRESRQQLLTNDANGDKEERKKVGLHSATLHLYTHALSLSPHTHTLVYRLYYAKYNNKNTHVALQFKTESMVEDLK